MAPQNRPKPIRQMQIHANASPPPDLWPLCAPLAHYLHFNHGNFQILMRNLQFYPNSVGAYVQRRARVRAHMRRLIDRALHLAIGQFDMRPTVTFPHYLFPFLLAAIIIWWIARHDLHRRNEQSVRTIERICLQASSVTQTYRTGAKQTAKWHLPSSGGKHWLLPPAKNRNRIEHGTFTFSVLVSRTLLLFSLIFDFARLPAQQMQRPCDSGPLFSARRRTWHS